MESIFYNLPPLGLNVCLVPINKLFPQLKTDNHTDYQVNSKQKHHISTYIHDNTPAMLCSFSPGMGNNNCDIEQKDGGSDGGLENKPIQARPWRLLVPERRCCNAAKSGTFQSIDR